MTQWIVTSCVLVLAILCLRHLLKGRISLRLQYALWAVVLVRLLVPVTFGQSPLSAANLVQAAQPTVSKMEAMEIPVQSFDSAYEEVVKEYIQQGKDVSGFENAEQLEYEAYERMEKLSLTQILTGIWIGGMALCFLALLTSNLHFAAQRRKRRRKVDISDCPLPVYADTGIKTPCLFGLFRPAVYVTEEVLADPTALDHVLAHEQSHYRHGDHLWAVLRGLCLCIHWYNPLVWVAAQISRRDAELACDERAIEKLGEDNRLDYGRTLIGLTCAKDTSPLRTATMMTGSNHSIKERITLIAKKPAFSAAAVIILLLAVTLAVGCSFTGPVENPSKYDVYAFPGTEWGMTPDAISKIMAQNGATLFLDKIAKENGFDQKSLHYHTTLFNTNALVSFSFLDFARDGTFQLDSILITLPQDADMDVIKRDMVFQYGKPDPDDLSSDKLRWDSNALFQEFLTKYDQKQFSTYNPSKLTEAATTIYLYTSTEHTDSECRGESSSIHIQFLSNAYIRNGGWFPQSTSP